MGTIRVHEFITLDGVIENPQWSAGTYRPAAAGAGAGE